jgi:hypothetical protein
VNIALYVVAGLFAVLALGLVFTYSQQHRSGFLLMAAAYGCGAGAAIALNVWWPLAVGFAAAWAVRLLGFDPDTTRK